MAHLPDSQRFSRSGRVSVLFLLITLVQVSFLHAADSSRESRRWWLELPRASEIAREDVSLPYAPRPGVKALERRALRGRPDAVRILERGPDPAALARLLEMGAEPRFVSRWLSCVSLEADPLLKARIQEEFGSQALWPVQTLFFKRPFAPRPAVGDPDLHKASQDLDYGPGAIQISQIQVDLLHEMGFDASGIRILVLDTGFQTAHTAFTQLNLQGEYDFIFMDGVTANETEDVSHQHNHGTAVLGTLAAFDAGALIGPAYGAEFLLAKTEDVRSETQVEEDNFIAALEWGEALGADVATASLGYVGFDDGSTYTYEDMDGDTALTTRAVDDMVALGVVALSAVGNSGPDPATLITPSDADSLLAIGAVDSLSSLAVFSSRGPSYDGRIKPDLSAMGVQTRCALAAGGYGTANGTSLATPLAAGVAALLLQAHPEWNPWQLGQALKSSASQFASPDNGLGYGIIRAADAAFSEDPVFPFPFALLEPADGITGEGATQLFSWRQPVDLQTPGELFYRIHFSRFEDFSDTLSLWTAGADTFRTLQFLAEDSFHWRVIATDPQQHSRISGGRMFTALHPTALAAQPGTRWADLGHPYPNPFNPRIRFQLSLQESARAELGIYDVAGRRVRLLETGRWIQPGSHSYRWEGTDDQGLEVSSGVYLLRLTATNARGEVQSRVRRLLLMR